MQKVKRKERRLWGRRLKGGWVIQPDELLKALKDGEVAEFGKLRVGAKQLGKLIALMRFTNQELLITTNGWLEVENIARVLTNGHTEFRKPRLRHSFRVDDGVWLPKGATRVVVLKPRKF